jgi:hypothetical protein
MAAEPADRPHHKEWGNPDGKALHEVHQERQFSKGSMKQVMGYGSQVIGMAACP